MTYIKGYVQIEECAMSYFYKKTISYYKDKIVSPPSYLYYGNVYTANSLRPRDAYMRRYINHHCFR